jgi:hypothetical protein
VRCCVSWVADCLFLAAVHFGAVREYVAVVVEARDVGVDEVVVSAPRVDPRVVLGLGRAVEGLVVDVLTTRATPEASRAARMEHIPVVLHRTAAVVV